MCAQIGTLAFGSQEGEQRYCACKRKKPLLPRLTAVPGDIERSEEPYGSEDKRL